MRRITEKGLELIKKYEGFSASPYICPAGYLTVGYGHVVKPHEVFDSPISPDFAEEILSTDVADAERAVLRLIRVPLTDGQFDALVSFTFNLGSGVLQRSTLRQKINRMEYSHVPKEFARWIYAGGKVLKGLVKRRNEEVLLFNS